MDSFLVPVADSTMAPLESMERDQSAAAPDYAPVARPTAADHPVGLGVIGLGAFGAFCLEAYLSMPEVRVVAIADSDPGALVAGVRLVPKALAYEDAAMLLALPQVEVVAICAPPDRHAALVLAAILAGKHVACDKPLGISLAEFDTAVAAATAHGVALGINLALRHHPLYRAIQRLTHSGLLGQPRRLVVENHAAEALGFDAAHWLWDPLRSGGLALAADIHWLDLATRLFGPAYEVHAWETQAGAGPRRLLTTAHDHGRIASIYHAFDTLPGATSCTVLLAFDGADLRIDGWIPTHLTVRCPREVASSVAATLDAMTPPLVTETDDRATIVLCAGSDRRGDYREMIRATLRLVLARARGETVDDDLAAARAATAAAIAAETAAVTRHWISIAPDGPLEATG